MRKIAAAAIIAQEPELYVSLDDLEDASSAFSAPQAAPSAAPGSGASSAFSSSQAAQAASSAFAPGATIVVGKDGGATLQGQAGSIPVRFQQLSPSDQASAQAEVGGMVSSLANLKAVSAQVGQDLKATADMLASKKAGLAQLKQQVVALGGKLPPGMAGLGGLGSGADQYFIGQVQKIDADVRSGRWTDMLIEAVRITPGASGADPATWLQDPLLTQIRQAIQDNYDPSEPYDANDPLGPIQRAEALKKIALAALAAMASNPPLQWDGQTPAPPPPPIPQPGQEDIAALKASAAKAAFDPAVLAQNNQGFSAYVMSHQPSSNFFQKAFKAATPVLKVAALPTKALEQIPGFKKVEQTLDKYVPGWSIALNLIIPGGGLLGAATSLVGQAGNIPIIGNVLQTVTGAPGQTGFFQAVTGAPGPAGGVVGGASAPPIALNIGGHTIYSTAQWALTETPLKIENQFPFSVSKVATVYLTTNGSIFQRLEAATIEGVGQFVFAAQACATILSFGSFAAADAAIAGAISSAASAVKGAIISANSGNPYDIALAATQAASSLVGLGGVLASASGAAKVVVDAFKYGLTAAKAGITVAKTEAMAQKIKQASDAVKQQAYAQAAQIDQQTAQLQAQVAVLKQQRALVEAQTAQLQRQTAALSAQAAEPAPPARPGTAAPAPQPDASWLPGPVAAPVSAASQALGLPPVVIVAGGVALAIALVVALSSDGED